VLVCCRPARQQNASPGEGLALEFKMLFQLQRWPSTQWLANNNADNGNELSVEGGHILIIY